VETVEHWDDGRAFSYAWEASGPVRDGRSVWTIEESGRGTRVRVDIEANMRWGPVGSLIGHTMLKSRMGKMMAEALEGLQHHVATGEVVDSAVAKRLGLQAA
jgi:carbon monoxide dehydrogenase subunit G